MGSTDDDDESIHQRLSSRTGEPIEIGAQQATGLLQRFHPNGDAERFVQSVLRQAKEDRKSTHQELRYGCGHSFGHEVRKEVLTKFRGRKITRTFVIQSVSEESREHKVDVHEILPPFV